MAQTIADGAATETVDDPKPSQQDDDGLYLTLKEQVMADIEHSEKWRANAKSEYHFVAGPGQWDAQDVQVLKEESRPAVTFNKTLKYIRAVCGIESNNRHEALFLPRHISESGEVKKNELLTGASAWMDDTSNAPRHQSRAFRDTAICGMGWTESIIDTDDDPRGLYREPRCNPLEMGWDRNAREQNLLDAKRVWRCRKMLLSEARALLPGITDSDKILDVDLDADWASGISSPKDGEPKTQQQKELRAENATAQDPKKEVHIVQIQWWEHETYFKALDPSSMQLIDLNKQQLAQHIQQWQGVVDRKAHVSKPLRRKVYKQAWLGSVLIDCGPCPRADGFTFQCMTYEPDDNEGIWYGLVRVLRDPQTWSNKFFAQTMHIVNSTAKGGILAEEDVFPDTAESLRNYARPNAVTIVKKGAIRNGAIMAKPGAGITAGVLQLLEIANANFSDTTGLNLELMGLADRDQPGILEAQRKQAAMTILATLFDSLSLFRQEKGRCRLHFIQTHLATDQARMIRIAGPEGYQAIPLLRQNVEGEYDVIVEDAPSSPNTKEKVWAALMQVLPAFREMITPEVAVMILEYAPGLPSKLVESLRQIAQRPDPERDAQQQLGKAQAAADIAKTQSEIDKNKAQSDASRAAAALDIATVGVQQAAANVQTFEALVSAIGAEKERRMQMAQSDPGGGIAPAGPQSRELPQLGALPEFGAEPPMMPQPGMVPAMPGALPQ